MQAAARRLNNHALIHNNEVKIGVIYLPITDELYVAEKDKGAFYHIRKRCNPRAALFRGALDRRLEEAEFELRVIETQLEQALERWRVLCVTHQLLQQVYIDYENSDVPRPEELE